jgi:hypothetical protein
MPALVRHAGLWEGTYRTVDSVGVEIDRHSSRIEVSFPDDGPHAYVQKNRFTWPDGRVVEAEHDLVVLSVGLQPGDDPRRFLGVEGDFGKQLGLPADFVPKIIGAVGNYGEIFDRNVGPGSRLKLDRGVNKQWKEGGLIYSPPFR